MKKTDIAMIILIASLSMLVSYLVANQIPGLKPPEKGVSVKTIDKISSDVDTVDGKTIPAGSINPTVQTVIGGGTNSAQ